MAFRAVCLLIRLTSSSIFFEFSLLSTPYSLLVVFWLPIYGSLIPHSQFRIPVHTPLRCSLPSFCFFRAGMPRARITITPVAIFRSVGASPSRRPMEMIIL
jgi:hypothetical protein